GRGSLGRYTHVRRRTTQSLIRPGPWSAHEGEQALAGDERPRSRSEPVYADPVRPLRVGPEHLVEAGGGEPSGDRGDQVGSTAMTGPDHGAASAQKRGQGPDGGGD